MHQEQLKTKLNSILDFIKDRNDVIYLDYPLHLNVGDLLIYHGTENFFKENGIHVKLRRSNARYSVEEIGKHVSAKTTILMHGGGNFGDLYPEFQKYREDIVSAFPKNRIIILPQTAYFSDISAIDYSAKKFTSHKDLIIFSRDSRSVDIFKKFTQNVQLMPDMAHSLWRTLPVSQSRSGVLKLIRKDKEINKVQEKILKGNTSKLVDWEDILRPRDLFVRRMCRKLDGIGSVVKMPFLKNISNRIWFKYTQGMVVHYALFFTSHEKVVTSRMHGHIFSCLLKVPNDLIDNAYGKNSGYFNEWTHDIENTRLIVE